MKNPNAPEGIAGSLERSHWLLRQSRAADAGAIRRALSRDGLELLGVTIVGLAVLGCGACLGVILLPYLWQPYGRVFATMYRRWIVRRGARLRPSEPWTWGTEADERGVQHPFERTRRGRRRLAIGLVLVAFASLLAMSAAGFRWVAVIPGVPGTIFLWYAFRDVRAGSLRIAWPKWPLRTGERVEFTLGVTDGGARFERVTVRLRGIEEHPGRAHLVWCRWTDIREFPRDFAPGPGHDVLVAFDVPATARGTRLDTPEASWWEVEVSGPTDAGQVRERIVLPIYDPLPPPLPDDGAAKPPDGAGAA